MTADELRAFLAGFPGLKVWAVVAERGRPYTPAPLNEDEWPRLEPTWCYDNALETCDASFGLAYVEGIAIPHAHDVPIHHAWCATPEGLVVDATWHPVGQVYLGIEFSDLELVRAARAAQETALGWALAVGDPVAA